jgi:C4-dicarboxylate-specific signal transduction histidine kinase
LAVQTVLIIALLVQNRRYSRARADVQRQYAEITHAARLALIGEITASVAHEVTQPLSAILSNVETAELLLSQPQPNVPMTCGPTASCAACGPCCASASCSSKMST